MPTATLLPFPAIPRLRLTMVLAFNAETGVGPAVAVLFANVVHGIDDRRGETSADQQRDQDDHDDGSRARS